MPGGRPIPECTQQHYRIIKKEELFLTLYNATLFKLYLTTCFTPPRCSENIQQISKFPSQNIFFGPSSVSNHIFELVQISVTEIKYIIMYRCRQKPQTCLMLFIQVHYQEFLGITYCQIESHSQWSDNTKSLLLQ
jgi:hypothetical protein